MQFISDLCKPCTYAIAAVIVVCLFILSFIRLGFCFSCFNIKEVTLAINKVAARQHCSVLAEIICIAANSLKTCKYDTIIINIILCAVLVYKSCGYLPFTKVMIRSVLISYNARKHLAICCKIIILTVDSMLTRKSSFILCRKIILITVFISIPAAYSLAVLAKTVKIVSCFNYA